MQPVFSGSVGQRYGGQVLHIKARETEGRERTSGTAIRRSSHHDIRAERVRGEKTDLLKERSEPSLDLVQN